MPRGILQTYGDPTQQLNLKVFRIGLHRREKSYTPESQKSRHDASRGLSGLRGLVYTRKFSSTSRFGNLTSIQSAVFLDYNNLDIQGVGSACTGGFHLKHASTSLMKPVAEKYGFRLQQGS
ncbi:hypothetical protein TNCV_3384811 [Trichonephila clavipes]|uniref:Uncharacterized protein n=1 Tax=Trichonephila clavipes TaxID=2585209 RepID=A0A8X6T3S9_TRICX|nr:hypothetical protein TNCV_3384811 [Trichonephila clavipes]